MRLGQTCIIWKSDKNIQSIVTKSSDVKVNKYYKRNLSRYFFVHDCTVDGINPTINPLPFPPVALMMDISSNNVTASLPG